MEHNGGESQGFGVQLVEVPEATVEQARAAKGEERRPCQELADALRELEAAPVDAAEDELEVPSEMAFDNARRLLKAMYDISPRRFGVYPMPEGYIAIDARGSEGRIAVVMCGSDGGVLWLVTDEGGHRRARYSTAHNLPDGFIREALAAL